MKTSDWLVNLNDFLQYYELTSNQLLFLAAILFAAFIFSLREFASWLTRTNHLHREVGYLKYSLKGVENKMDQLMALQIEKNTGNGEQECSPLPKTLVGKKTESNRLNKLPRIEKSFALRQ